MKKLRHKNVIRLYEVIDNPDHDKFYMGKNKRKIFSLGFR